MYNALSSAIVNFSPPTTNVKRRETSCWNCKKTPVAALDQIIHLEPQGSNTFPRRKRSAHFPVLIVFNEYFGSVKVAAAIQMTKRNMSMKELWKPRSLITNADTIGTDMLRIWTIVLEAEKNPLKSSPLPNCDRHKFCAAEKKPRTPQSERQ